MEIRYSILTDDDHTRLLDQARRAENKLGLAKHLADASASPTAT